MQPVRYTHSSGLQFAKSCWEKMSFEGSFGGGERAVLCVRLRKQGRRQDGKAGPPEGLRDLWGSREGRGGGGGGGGSGGTEQSTGNGPAGDEEWQSRAHSVQASRISRLRKAFSPAALSTG